MPTTTPTNQIVAGELENGAKDDETSLNEQRRVHMQSIVPQSKPSSGGDSDEFSDEEENDFGRQFNNELKKRRRTIVNSFRLAELIPTTNTPYSSYRRKSVVLTAQSVVDAKAEEHFVEGLKLSDAEEDYHAILSFNKAISLKPEQIRYYVSRGESYLQTCDFQSAILNYKKACILDPDSDEYYSRLAFLYFFQGQCLFDEKLYSEALESFSRAAEMKPEVIGYHTRSVACLAALQRHGECLALVNKRLEEEIENPDLFIMRARLHELFRNSTLCYYDVKDALALAPENTEAQTLMRTLEKRARDCKQQAVQLLLVGKVKEALTKISIAIETNPSVAEYHVFRGALHRRNFDFNAAIDDYLLAMDKTEHEETHPNYKEAQRQLLLCYNDFAVECFSKGFYDEAVVLLNKAIKGEKREKGLYINRGDCFFHSSELHFAQADYLQALEMDPENQAVKSRLSIVYNEFGILDYYDRHYLESIDHLTAAIRFNPRIAAYYLSRARARYMIEDTDGARNDVLMSAYLDPDNKELLSIFSRLFPGRTLSDVMKSHLGKAAARAVEATIRETYSHQPLAAEAAGIARSSQEASKFSGKAVLPPIFPDLRVCMKEKDFHVNIIRGKKKATKTVKKALNTRQDLRYKGPRVESKIPSLPSASRSRTLKFGSNLEKPLLNPTSKEQKAIFT